VCSILKLKLPQVSDWSANEDFAQRHVIFEGVTPLLNIIEKAFFSTRISFALTRKIILVEILEEHDMWDYHENYLSKIEALGLTLKLWDLH